MGYSVCFSTSLSFLFLSSPLSSKTSHVASLIGVTATTASTPSAASQQRVLVAVFDVTLIFLPADRSPFASHGESAAPEHAAAESNDGDPEPGVLELLLLRLDFLSCLSARALALIIMPVTTVHAWMMHKSFSEQRQQSHGQQLDMSHRAYDALLLRHCRYRLLIINSIYFFQT